MNARDQLSLKRRLRELGYNSRIQIRGSKCILIASTPGWGRGCNRSKFLIQVLKYDYPNLEIIQDDGDCVKLILVDIVKMLNTQWS